MVQRLLLLLLRRPQWTVRVIQPIYSQYVAVTVSIQQLWPLRGSQSCADLCVHQNQLLKQRNVNRNTTVITRSFFKIVSISEVYRNILIDSLRSFNYHGNIH